MTALVGFHLMALAARTGVKVILNGQGADEVIGGYGNYFKERWTELVRNGRPRHAWREITAYTLAHGGNAGQRFWGVMRHIAQRALWGFPPYRALSNKRRIARMRARSWLRPELIDYLPQRSDLTLDGVQAVLADSIDRSPLPLYLRVEDRNSMAHSIEVRLPFLDHRLVGLVFSMDAAWKINGPWNKYVLREGMRGRIPESVRSRLDKMGFPTDASAWFKGPLYSRLRDIFNDSAFRQNPFFDAKQTLADLEAHRAGTAVHTDRLFNAAQIHLWCEQSARP